MASWPALFVRIAPVHTPTALAAARGSGVPYLADRSGPPVALAVRLAHAVMRVRPKQVWHVAALPGAVTNGKPPLRSGCARRPLPGGSQRLRLPRVPCHPAAD